jgi:aldose 1-epimerase
MTKDCKLSVKSFGTIEGQDIQLFRLSNGSMDVEITNYGATIVSIFTPDKDGQQRNIVAGFDNLDQYLSEHPYLGCIVGRFANRIAYGKCTIDGQLYQLPLNDTANHLHGGVEGFNRKVWSVVNKIEEEERVGVELTYLSPDGEEGYPGNLQVAVKYLLTPDNDLEIGYTASTDKATVISLTNHSYFNLTGFETPTIYDHYLTIHAGAYTVKNENNTPSGEIATVKHTPFDFTKARKLGEQINVLATDRGYDHNFVLPTSPGEVSIVAQLYEPVSGCQLAVLTDQPGMQVYTANWWDGTLRGHQDTYYQQHGAIALETQAFPDAPNQPHFPSALLQPGEVYARKTIFRFTVDGEEGKKTISIN